VLLIEHGAGGARGLVINRPSDLKLSALSSEIEGLRNRKDPVYIGGPVPGGPIFVLIRSDRPVDDATPVLDHVFLSRDKSILEGLSENPESEFRVYAGYAGWAPGQLEAEVRRGDWYILPAGPEWIFTHWPAEIWDRLIPPEPSRQARTPTPVYRPSRYGSGAKSESSNPRERSLRANGSPGSGQ
jgi:putative transcriptional regulator